MEKLIKINPLDNVAVAISPLSKGDIVTLEDKTFTLLTDLPAGHKLSLSDINEGEKVIKYGYSIGFATRNIEKGEHVHNFNIKTTLSDDASYTYDEKLAKEFIEDEKLLKKKWEGNVPSINAYKRSNGKVGIRNSLWIIPAVGCVNKVGEKLAAWANENLNLEDGCFVWTHPFGCSQMGGDHETTQMLLADLVHHPNAGGVLVLHLGCENNTPESFRKVIGDIDEERVKFLTTQDEVDEIAKGQMLLTELAAKINSDKRESCLFSDLVIGFKCGGSDGFSGITANSLVGFFSDDFNAMGGTTILTEVPEMFGAEQLLMNRAVNKEVYEDTVNLINNFKGYFTAHDQVVYENPSPGNKAGGISTLEDKSLGCVQKGGRAPVEAVIKYGERVSKKGLNLLQGPGNDIVSTTVQSAAGANIILFTTGRGTPLGSVVPTVKISSNTELAEHKPNWIDFNAGRLLTESREKLTQELIKYLVSVANGERTKNEINGYSEISIFKDGVIL